MNEQSKSEQLKAEAAQHEQDAHESFERCDTDGFLSQWASGMMASLKRAQARIEEQGGRAIFTRVRLAKLDSSEIVREAKLIETRFGRRWRIDSTDEWLPYQPKRESTLAKSGYRELTEYQLAPAKATHWAPPGARGMSGATSVQTIIVRTDDLEGGGRERNEWRFAGYPDDADLFELAILDQQFGAGAGEGRLRFEAEREVEMNESEHGAWLDARIAGELPILLGCLIEGTYGSSSEPWIFDEGATIIPSKRKRSDGRIWISGPGRSIYGDPTEVRAVVERADLLAAIAATAAEVARGERAAGWDSQP
jgi:hypothetical protein